MSWLRPPLLLLRPATGRGCFAGGDMRETYMHVGGVIVTDPLTVGVAFGRPADYP